MRFQITLNMPSRAGNPVHQIICDHAASSLAHFVDEMQELGFIIVSEIYRDGDTGEFYAVGDIAINARWVGKVKVFN